MTRPILDGAYYATGSFVFQRALARRENGQETVISHQRTVCEVPKGAGNPAGTAQQIASALNAQHRAEG
ncbi:hypothetical protein KX928_12750 [Roseobacter sp. YSTF-M11]|uniref:Uncharacterized protein n=1 Tax=Roseobacter insulae TaxID=2859783 RepID=A0A9X1FVR2_9RHOB|nr:hypothetical protein [Roseobacter insulae]MBW4708654.1 hypothetical protein [Roseobacter insulae]